MLSIADEEKLGEVANFLINERGYLVVGLAPHNSYRIGQIIHILWNSQVKQPLRVVAITDVADWKSQQKLASAQFDATFKKSFYVDSRGGLETHEMGNFYRLITD